jgi:diguanylate cyclase (GGDEF)-like protein/PAS domain S-box-containing protein
MSADRTQTGTEKEKIVSSDHKFWLAFEHANVGMALVLPDGRFQRVNAEFCRLLGYTERQLKELDLQTVTHRDDLGEEMRSIKQALEGKATTYHLEKQFARRDGSVALASVAATLDYDRVGNPLHFIYMAQHLPEPETLPEPASGDYIPVQSQLELEYEDRLFQFLEAVPVAMYVVDGTGMPYYANGPAQDLLGIGVNPEAPADPLARAHPLSITGTDEPYPEERMPIIRALLGEKSSVDDIEIRKPGSGVPVQAWGAPIFNANGEIIFAVSAFTDVSDRMAARDEFMTAQDRYEAICDNVAEFISVHDLKGNYRFASPACAGLTGYDPQEMSGTDPRVYMHPDDLPVVGKTFLRYAAGSDEHMRATYRVRRKDGEYVWVETRARPILGTYGLRREVLCVTRSMEEGRELQASLLEEKQEREEHDRELEMLALIDTATGIKNRRAVDEQLYRRLASRRASTYPLGCLIVDVDRFSAMREKYGEEVGDQVLKKVASIISNACRGEDFVGRYDRDEFIVLLPNTDAAGTVVVGEKLISNVQTAYWADTPVMENITVSIGGICITRYTGMTEAGLIDTLESQLYEAKQGGRNRMVMNARRAISGQWAALSGR